MVSSSNPLDFFVKESKIKSSLDFQLTKVNETLPDITDKKMHEFSLIKVKKKKN